MIPKSLLAFILPLLLPALFSSVARAQYNYDVKVQNRPVVHFYPYDQTVTDSIKCVTVLEIKEPVTKGASAVADTIRIVYYDSSGRETSELRYSFKRPYVLSTRFYDSSGHLLKHIQHPLAENEGVYHSYYTYSDGRLTGGTTYYIKARYNTIDAGDGMVAAIYVSGNGDTSSVYRHRYGYDSLARLNYRKHNTGEQYFFYENNVLVKHENHLNDSSRINKLGKDRNGRPNRLGDIHRTIYTYNKEGQLEREDIFLDTLTGSVLAGWARYKYRDTLLVKESYIRSTGNISTKTTVTYEYNSSNQLIKTISKNNKDRLEVSYEYESGGRLSRVKVSKKGKSPLSEFSFQAPVGGKEKFVYEELYVYDERGNPKEQLITLDGKLVKTNRYVVEYY